MAKLREYYFRKEVWSLSYLLSPCFKITHLAIWLHLVLCLKRTKNQGSSNSVWKTKTYNFVNSWSYCYIKVHVLYLHSYLDDLYNISMEFLDFHYLRQTWVGWPRTDFKPNCLDCQIITKNTRTFGNYIHPGKAVEHKVFLHLPCTESVTDTLTRYRTASGHKFLLVPVNQSSRRRTLAWKKENYW